MRADIASTIHESSVIDPGTTIGAGCTVWHFCHVSAGATIGDGSSLGQNVFVGEGVQVGKRVKIQNNVSVYAGVLVEDDAFIGPSVVFTNVLNPRSTISRKSEFKTTRVGHGATIGANATVVCGHQLGDYCFVGAGSVVTRDVAPYSLVVGNPARHIGWVNESGERVATPPRVQVDSIAASVTPIRMLDPRAENASIQEALEATAARVLRSGHYVQGPEVKKFELAAAEFLQVKQAISCSSGTDALLLSLMALDIGPGDEVITSPFSFVSAVESILRVGAMPVFIDIDSDTFNLDLNQLEAALTPRTRAVLPVHLFGQSLDLSPIQALLRAREIPVIQDAAQAFGAKDEFGMLGGGPGLSCFSFFPSKNLGGFGDGGLVTTDSPALSEQLRKLRSHGAAQKYHHEHVGGNFRMDALQAALLSVKLPHSRSLIEKRQAHAALYLDLFQEAAVPAEKLRLPQRKGPDHTYNQFVVQVDNRDALQAHLKERGIETTVYYPEPLHLQPMLQERQGAPGEFPLAEKACAQALALPIHPTLQETEVERVAEAVIQFIRCAESSRGAPSK